MKSAAVVLGILIGRAVVLSAQTPEPGHGTMALEGTMKTFYKAANTVVVATIDGVEHVYHFTKDLVVHGGKGRGVDALAGLQEGTTVVVHYVPTDAGEAAVEVDRIDADGLKITEGVVTDIDRKRNEITIRFDNGTRETLTLTARASADAGKDIEPAASSGTKIIVYYSDEGGRKVAHYFKRAKG